ncbi:NAD(P)H-hydrate dehydratase [Pontivivens nitratireducens]|uniref:Bifunctional NAD(P)H-hydrate repair enzyme n=1 Tax=Pontivivens nitratireducens TaxID=2758038 RepID=A0A6G7VN05_9RHOB|nr:NAD(P)H-hydrate dehydratase [Pontibrevibacter nitratireducens]QIK41429.1 NAD(P)H-hydrate dehydratase [Pontibrevibacter nitratireducens]
MPELLTADQMRAVERAAIDNGRVTGLDLMERAGRGVIAAMLEHWPHFAVTPGRAAVLCGPGNNGGDGFVVARLLRDRGWDVTVFAYGEVAKLPPDAAINAQGWTETAPVQPASLFTDLREECDLIVDAILGIGATRPLQGAIEATVKFLNEYKPGERKPRDRCRIVSVDLPTGLCSDSGRPLGSAVRADLTVTFHRAKPGHYLSDGPAHCGRLSVQPLGLDREPTYPHETVSATLIGEETLKRGQVPCLGKRAGGHKFSHGHAVVAAGSVGKGGAARLSARAALRIGAGLVTVAPPPAALIENAAHLDAIMLHAIRDARGLEEMLTDERIKALCLGPGLGGDRARDLVPVALAASRGTVLDADALSAFADDPQELFAMLHDRCVLTPHGGEFARLFPDIADRLDAMPARGPAFSRMDAARAAAARAGCTVLLKGPDTVVADPDGRISLNPAVYARAAPWLATAGSGDVLSGMIAGLLARGDTPHEAAATAAWLHTECALEFGPGLIAEDLPEQIPAVLRRLSANSP